MRLEESVAAYREQLRDGKNELANTAGLAEALLATGEYREALLLFERAGAAEKAAAPGTMGRDIQVSVCEWLRGERARVQRSCGHSSPALGMGPLPMPVTSRVE